MVKFIGEYPAKVDDKGRVVFPSGLKDQLVRCQTKDGIASADAASSVDWRFVVKKSLWSPCLEMYTFAEWERESEGVKSKINFLNRKESDFWREYTRNRALVEPESRLGRITVPKALMNSIGAGKELVFCGCDHKIEIWAKERFEESGLSQEEFVSLAESISEK